MGILIKDIHKLFSEVYKIPEDIRKAFGITIYISKKYAEFNAFRFDYNDVKFEKSIYKIDEVTVSGKTYTVKFNDYSAILFHADKFSNGKMVGITIINGY
jgi:hypothetical protein